MYCRETGTPANSEFSRAKSLATNTLTLEEAQTRNHTSGIAVVTLAEMWAWNLNLIDVSRLRLVVDSASLAAGQTVDVEGFINLVNSVA